MQSSEDRITTSLSLAHQRKNKQANKNSAQILPYKKLTQTTGPTLEGRNQKEERIKKKILSSVALPPRW